MCVPKSDYRIELTEPFRGVVRTVWCRKLRREWMHRHKIGLFCVSLLSAKADLYFLKGFG